MYSGYEELKKAFYESRNNSSRIGYESDSYDCDDDFIFDDDDADCFCD